MAGKKYSEAQKIGYYSGKAYATAKKGKRVRLKTEKARNAFKQGVKSVRG